MTTLKGVKILFVDDRFDIANIYISRARREGAEVVYQSKLMAAFTALASEPFDLAIIDLHMPSPAAPWPAFCRTSIEALVNNQSDTVRSHNLGQMIGHFINNSLGGRPPFIYLSAVAGYFEPLVDAQMPHGAKCLDRYKTTAVDLIKVITEVLDR